MTGSSLLLRSLFWCLLVLVVHCQTVPYVSFMGVNLPNHSYVDLTLVGEDISDPGNTVRCHSDLTTCCSTGEGDHRGSWFFPNADILKFPSTSDDIVMDREPQEVHLLRRNDVISPSGIYRCDIETIAVNDDVRATITGETVYVGLYPPSEGDISIPGGVTLSMNTLTCNSTGGPATTVTWTRDSVIITEGTETVLNDPVTAQYTHTLTVTKEGLYTCTVANNKPSNASANIIVQGPAPPTNVIAVRDSVTSILVSWTPSSDAIGYRIDYYTSEGHNGSETVIGGSTNDYILTGLHNGDVYTIFVTSLSQYISSDCVQADMNVGCPAPLSVSVGPSTPTSIILFWNVSIDSVVFSFEVSWQRVAMVTCLDVDEGSIIGAYGSGSIAIMGLEEDSNYIITMTASNTACSVNDTVTGMTREAVPSKAPTTVTATGTSYDIIVQWGDVDCIHHNGDITGYSVRVVHDDDGSEPPRVISVVGDNVRQATVSGLTPYAVYSVSVATVNSVGIGVYSTSIEIETEAVLVGLEKTVYSVSESDGVVKVCANVTRPVLLQCPFPHTFSVIISTTPRVAVAPSDYKAINHTMVFQECETGRCIDISIIDDLVNEPDDEVFDVTLQRAVGLTSSISLVPVNAEIAIVNDNDARPDAVIITPVNATVVMVTWSGSAYLPTSLRYNSIYNTTGAVMTRYEVVLPVGVASVNVTLNDDVMGYVHKFSLNYVVEDDDETAPVTVETFVFDKKMFQIQFGPIEYCLNWGLGKTGEEIEEQLQTQIVRVIRERWGPAGFDFTAAFIRQGVFHCHGNPSKTTYRSTIINPFPTTNSAQLVSIIQNWVSTSPALTFGRLLVRVNSECLTCVESVEEDECEWSTEVIDPREMARISQVLSVCAVREIGEEICNL